MVRSGQNRSLTGGLQPRVIPAEARDEISASNRCPTVSANDTSPGSSPKARYKKAATCPRVTGSSGQNRSLTGGLQPRVIPAEANAATSGSNKCPTVSLNDTSPGSSPKARYRKAATCPRVTGSSGQNRSLTGGLQPRVIPSRTIQAISSSKMCPDTSNNPTADPSDRAETGNTNDAKTKKEVNTTPRRRRRSGREPKAINSGTCRRRTGEHTRQTHGRNAQEELRRLERWRSS